jgi:hypothetical protein
VLVKLLLSLAIAIVFTLLVYLGMTESLTRSSLNFQAIPQNIALSIVLNENNITKDQFDDAKFKFVFIKGNGELYLSDNVTKKIGPSIGTTSPTFTTGNHYVWEIKLIPMNTTYYVDHINGEIIARKDV